MIKEAYTYDDLLLVPQYSGLTSRTEADISTYILGRRLSLPIFSAAMNTITGRKMQVTMIEAGGGSIHHRYSISDDEVIVAAHYDAVAISPSMGKGLLDKLTQSNNKHVVVAIDVAHGDNSRAIDYAEAAAWRGLDVISGNIVTVEAAKRYIDVGAKVLKIGIGPGSVCSTRQVAGVGYPQLSAIMDIYEYTKNIPGISLIADGGIKYSGDIVKALAAGADAVIIGGLLAGTDACPMLPDKWGNVHYYGMASKKALNDAGKEVNPEGVATTIAFRGKTTDVLNNLEKGVRAGFAYLGARNINELREKAQWVKVTANGLAEGMPRV